GRAAAACREHGRPCVPGLRDRRVRGRRPAARRGARPARGRARAARRRHRVLHRLRGVQARLPPDLPAVRLLSAAAGAVDMTWQFVIAGLAVGTLVGMTGMGGGSLMTPMLILIFGFDPKTAVGTDILHGAVFKSFGAWRHRQLGNVHLPLAAWLFIGSGPFSLLGVQLASSFSARTESTMTKIIGGALILGGLGFLAKTFITPHTSDAPFRLTRRDKLVAVAIGASCGFVVGLTSVGSGTFFGLFMLFLFPLSATRMVGTDVTHAAALLWVAGA